MTLKKNLKTNQAQAVVEYIVTFLVLAVSVIVVFGAFNPETININSAFNGAVTRAINRIDNGW